MKEFITKHPWICLLCVATVCESTVRIVKIANKKKKEE